jgi:hypothetical protein
LCTDLGRTSRFAGSASVRRSLRVVLPAFRNVWGAEASG